MTTEHLIADPSNASQVDAWDGGGGEFWVTNARRFDESLANHHGPFLTAAGIGEYDHVLDVGCGCGLTTRDAARLAVKGFALGVDLSSPMIALARQTTTAEGIGNVEFQQADAQIHPFDADAFDAVISRTGAMFFGDPVAAFTNLHRALRPGGRLTLLTWQTIADNEWISEFAPRSPRAGSCRFLRPMHRVRSRWPTPTASTRSWAPPASPMFHSKLFMRR